MARINVTDIVVPRYLHPHVNTVVVDNTFYNPEVSVVSTNNVNMIGVFQSERGRVNEFIDVNNASALIEIFGEPDVGKYGLQQLAALSALQSGVVNMKAMRVAPQAGKGSSEAQSAKYANLMAYASMRKKTYGGSSLTPFPSSYRFESNVTTIIQSFTITNGGSGFVVGDLVSPINVSMSGITDSMLPKWIVTAVTSTGAIRALKVSSYGSIPGGIPLGTPLQINTVGGSFPATLSNVIYADKDTQGKTLSPITPSISDSNGNGLKLGVTITGDEVSAITIDDVGSGYKAGEFVTLDVTDPLRINAVLKIIAVSNPDGEVQLVSIITGGKYVSTVAGSNVSTKPYSSGGTFSLDEIVINTPGTLYKIGDQLVLDQIDSSRTPVFTVTKITANGVIESIVITKPGKLTADDITMVGYSGVPLNVLGSSLGSGVTVDLKFSNEIKWTEMFIDSECVSIQGVYNDDFLRTQFETYRTPDGLQVPLFYVRTDGIGKYGNDYRLRIRRDVNVESDMNLKAYAFEVLENKTSLMLKATYSGSLIYSPRYTNVPIQIKDVIDEITNGYAFIDVYNDEESFETLYNHFTNIVASNNTVNNPNLQYWLNLLFDSDPDISTKYQKLAGIPTIANGGITKDAVLLQYTPDGIAADTYNRTVLSKLSAMRDKIASTIDIDEFDPIFGYMIGSNDKIPYLDLTFTSLTDYNIFNSQTGIVNIGFNTINDLADIDGIQLMNGSDGILDNYAYDSEDYRALSEQLYAHAFSGYYDPNIKSTTKVPYDVLIDCNYSIPVKQIMYNTNVLRDDAVLYLDMGKDLKHMIDVENIVSLNNFGAFNSRTCSLNFQNYTKKDTVSGKNIQVPITFFFWERLPLFIQLNGTHTPFTFNYATLTGHVRNSLRPEVSAKVIWQQGFQYQSTEEAEYKEFLNEHRLNYFVTTGDNEFKRGIQNTTQKAYSLLLEESNVRVCWDLKRRIEKELNSYLFLWGDAQARANYTQHVQSVYADWIGSRIESFKVQFTVTPWESERNILRCTIDIAPRKFNKIITFVMNINKPNPEL